MCTHPLEHAWPSATRAPVVLGGLCEEVAVALERDRRGVAFRAWRSLERSVRTACVSERSDDRDEQESEGLVRLLAKGKLSDAESVGKERQDRIFGDTSTTLREHTLRDRRIDLNNTSRQHLESTL